MKTGGPLLHFLMIGAALYGLEQVLFPGDPPAPEPVRVDAATVDAIGRDWARATGRSPTSGELELLIEDRVDSELMLREALTQGFHRDDAVVWRRLIANQRFLESEGAAEPATEAELFERALAHGMQRTDLVVRRRLIERMRSRIVRVAASERPLAPPAPEPGDPLRVVPEPRVRLTHVFLSRDLRGARLEADADALQKHLIVDSVSPHEARALGLGDPLLVPFSLPPSSERQLAARLGPGFARSAMTLEPGRWSAPLPSSYGLHLVWIEERIEQSPAGSSRLAEVSREADRDRISLRRGLDALRRDVAIEREPVPN